MDIYGRHFNCNEALGFKAETVAEVLPRQLQSLPEVKARNDKSSWLVPGSHGKRQPVKTIPERNEA